MRPHRREKNINQNSIILMYISGPFYGEGSSFSAGRQEKLPYVAIYILEWEAVESGI